jgi:hypothetical protein
MLACGKHFFTINPMLPARSKVTSRTLFLRYNGILSNKGIIVSECVPFKIATIVPFFPLAALFERIV